MPMVKFPYTKDGEKKAKAAAKQYGGRYISDEKSKGNGASVVIAVRSAKKPKSKKKKMAYGGMVAKKNKK